MPFEDAPPPSPGEAAPPPEVAALASGDDAERERLANALMQCGGNQSRAAKFLGIPRRSAWYALASYFALWWLTRELTPPQANVNLAFRIPSGWVAHFPNSPVYFLSLLVSGAATFAIAEHFARQRQA